MLELRCYVGVLFCRTENWLLFLCIRECCLLYCISWKLHKCNVNQYWWITQLTKQNQNKLSHNGSILNCRSKGQLTDPAWFILKFISLAQVVPCPVQHYSAELWPKAPFIHSLDCRCLYIHKRYFSDGSCYWHNLWCFEVPMSYFVIGYHPGSCCEFSELVFQVTQTSDLSNNWNVISSATCTHMISAFSVWAKPFFVIQIFWEVWYIGWHQRKGAEL